VFKAASEAPTYISRRHIVAAFTNALPNAADRLARVRYPDEVQLDDIAALLRPFEQLT